MIDFIEGGLHEDLRGRLRFCNDFDMSPIKRFYTICNSVEHPVRGWIGHKKETKWFFPLYGRTGIVVKPMASSEDGVQEVVLDANKPSVCKVEPGHWFSIKQYEKSEVMVFSNCKVGEFGNDDFRREYEEA